MSSASLNVASFPSNRNDIVLRDAGVGTNANGYCFWSGPRDLLGGRMRKGGNLVVVVVVVVTTVVWVAGAKAKRPKAVPGSRPLIVFFPLLLGLRVS